MGRYWRYQKHLKTKTELQADLDPIKEDIKEINIKVDRIEKKLDAVHVQTADLTEFRTETKEGIESIRKILVS